jgi:SAM-dependent methyltransferase
VNPRRRRIEARVRLTRLALGAWAAQVLFVANDLGVFDLLDREGPSTGSEIAARLGTDADATSRLLGALVAAGLLEHEGDRFANSDTTRELLVPGKPETITTWVSLMGRWTENFANLGESIRTGKPAGTPEGHSLEELRSYMHAMHEFAVGPGREFARHLNLEGRRRLLDVGGGPGSYSILLAEANPELSCTVFDLPDVVRVAAEMIEQHGAAARVSTLAGDYNADPIPQGYDVVLISNTLHQEDEGAVRGLLSKVFDAIEPGGICVIHGLPLNETKDGPLWPALLNVQLRLVSQGGRAYTVEEYREQLLEAGFVEPVAHAMSTFNANSYVVARRP